MLHTVVGGGGCQISQKKILRKVYGLRVGAGRKQVYAISP